MTTTEDVNTKAQKEWSAIAARDKVAFFAADVSRRDGAGGTLLTYTVCFPDGQITNEASDLISQKLNELAYAIRNAWWQETA